jgi:glycosyltransferase involved in cell wall biosynthesis
MLVFPSLYEGFGLPVLEAQACGLPCVISNISSLPEVGGDAALYCDPESSDDIADKISILAKDPTLQAELREKGSKNILRFDWDRYVDNLVKTYSLLSR